MEVEKNLLEHQANLKEQIAGGHYNIFVTRMLDWIGQSIQKTIRRARQPSFLYSAILLSLLALLFDFAISLVFNEFHLNNRGDFIPVELLITVVIFVLLVSLRTYFSSLLHVFHDRLIEQIQDTRDLQDLQTWLADVSNSKKSLTFALICCFAGSAYFLIPLIVLGIAPTGGDFGAIELGAVLFFLLGFEFYYFAHILALALRISRYSLKVYELAPKYSEVIKDIANLMMNFTYQIALVMAVLTAALVLLGWSKLPLLAPLILFTWCLIVILFATSQLALARIITSAKWKTLNRLQSQIEQMQGNSNWLDKDSGEAMNRLMDFHERVQQTPDSALDLRSVLGFVNSLLLPLLAFVLANFRDLIQIFGK